MTRKQLDDLGLSRNTVPRVSHWIRIDDLAKGRAGLTSPIVKFSTMRNRWHLQGQGAPSRATCCSSAP
jgi:hypothetical protein